MLQHLLDHVILWAVFNLAFFQRIHLQSPIRPLCPPHFQLHDRYAVNGTQLQLTQPHACAHQAIKDCPLQVGPYKHRSKVLVTYRFGDYLLQAQSPSSLTPGD